MNTRINKSLSENWERCCDWGFCFWARRSTRSIPGAGCDGCDNEAQKQKTRRPEGFCGEGWLAALLLSQRPIKGILLRRALPSSPRRKNSIIPNFQTGSNRLALFLAGILPFMPVLRMAVPVMRTLGNPSAAWVFKWVIGAAIVGYDAISSASSVSISPPTATVGVPYTGTITYSGGHAGAVLSMAINGTCLGSYTIAPGLTATYSGVNTARVTSNINFTTNALLAGTMTTNMNLTILVTDGSGCGGGLTDTRVTSLIIQPSGSGKVAPTMLTTPQNTIAPVGSDVILSGGASGNPTPTYFWKQGITIVPGATNNTLLIPSAQLTNAGLYSLYASNSQNVISAPCYLTMAVTPGSNNLTLFFTNYVQANTALTMYSYITNSPFATNTYAWTRNGVSIPGITVTNPNLTLPSADTGPHQSGTFTVAFTSVIGASTPVNGVTYDSYWVFGYPPIIPIQPQPQTVNAGTNVTFSFVLAGGNYPYVFLYQNLTNLVAQTNLSSYNPLTASTSTGISLTVSNVTPASSGNYAFVVSNFWGSITSSPASLIVSSPLSVPTPPSQTDYSGNNVTLNAAPAGTGPFYFQWQKGGSSLTDGGNISGSGTSNLLIAPVAVSNGGNYQVVVTNLSGSVTSGVAVLTVLPVPSLSAATGSGGLTLNASGGVVGSNYVVEVSSNLASGAWIPLQTNVVPPGGAISFTGTNTSAPGLFYRLLFP